MFPPSPPEPVPGTFGYQVMMRQREKAEAARKEREAQQERQRRENEEAEAERVAAWNANRPQREAALDEIKRLEDEVAPVEAELARLDHRIDAFRERRRELWEIAQMYAKPAEPEPH